MSKKQRPFRILGAMSGTSCDALDMSVVEFDGRSWSPLWNVSVPYPVKLRKRVQDLQKSGTRVSLTDLAALDRDLGKWYGNSFKKAIDNAPNSERPDAISNHGQTVGHFPFLKEGGVTLQLGDPNQIVQKTGVTVISHHRHGDLAGGGQGAPFVPSFHALLALSVLGEKSGIAIHNLGGISNFTYLGPKRTLLASDTGPANLWIDEAARWLSGGKKNFDENGEGAASGNINPKVLDEMLRHPFLKKKLPKSTGRDDFSFEQLHRFLKKMKRDQVLPTVTAFTVESIARLYEREILSRGLPLKRLILAGGGVKNETVLQWLGLRLSPVTLETVEDHGLDSQFIEAQAFAFLGIQVLQGMPLGGTWTGGDQALSGGRITPGPNWDSIRNRFP